MGGASIIYLDSGIPFVPKVLIQGGGWSAGIANPHPAMLASTTNPYRLRIDVEHTKSQRRYIFDAKSKEKSMSREDLTETSLIHCTRLYNLFLCYILRGPIVFHAYCNSDLLSQ